VTPADHLAPYHAQDSAHAERVIPLLDDPALCRVVVAWSLLPVTFRPPKGKPPADERERWAWLWDGCVYDVPDLAAACGLASSHVLALMRRAVAGRLVCPDGTISTAAEQYLKAQVVARLAPAARAQASARRDRP
jgi:hypothetical protein